MKQRFPYFLLLISLLFFSYRRISSPASGSNNLGGKQTVCDIDNYPFAAGEELYYQTSYNWGFIWLNAGYVNFKIERNDFNGKPCYKLSGNGSTFPAYDWIFKVRDRYESWADTASLKPFRFVRDIHEGGNNYFNECYYNFNRLKGYTVTHDNKLKIAVDTIPVSPCSFDPLTMIYFSRTIDYSRYKPNDTIPISLYLDNKVYSLYIHYLGKERLTMDDKSVYNCIKFRPLLIAGTLFKAGEGMTVWATDDKNQIPLYVEAPILVGTVRAKITGWKNLKYKVEAKVEK